MSETKIVVVGAGGECPRKAVMCFDCFNITFVDLPHGLMRPSWHDDPLPPGWRWVVSEFPGTMGHSLRAQCDICAGLAETDPEKLTFRIANARNLHFRDT